jgi:hypothetical protein
MPGTDGGRQTLAQRLRAAATERLALKFAALFFALVLWLVVSAEEPTEQVVQIAVAPRLDSTLMLIGRRPVVRALVVGRARELLELAADPPVARPVMDADALDGDSATIAVLPRDIEVPTNVQVLVREVRPRTVVIQVARVSRPLPPETQAESALAGLVAPRVRVDTSRALRDVIPLDTAPLDSLPRDTMVTDSARADTLPPADTARGRQRPTGGTPSGPPRGTPPARPRRP